MDYTFAFTLSELQDLMQLEREFPEKFELTIQHLADTKATVLAIVEKKTGDASILKEAQ